MKGAREFYGLFKTGQYGRLYIVSGAHARGRTLRIQVLPEGEIAIPNGENNNCLNSDAVEVYGETGGQSGWTETYGWLHEGKWVGDFNKLVEQRRAEIKEEELKREQENADFKDAEEDRVTSLLAKY